MEKGIITVVGKDQVGIIAKVCTYLADNKLNILDINARDSNGKNALYWAINKNKIETIKELISLNVTQYLTKSLYSLKHTFAN